MAQLKDLIVNGVGRFLGKVYAKAFETNKVKILDDNEGGNIVITGSDGNQWQIDSYNGTSLRIYYSKDGGASVTQSFEISSSGGISTSGKGSVLFVSSFDSSTGTLNTVS